LAAAELHGGDRSHGLDALDIDFIELFDKAENGVELTFVSRDIVFGNPDAGETTNAPYGIGIDRHMRLLGLEWNFNLRLSFAECRLLLVVIGLLATPLGRWQSPNPLHLHRQSRFQHDEAGSAEKRGQG